MDYGCEASCYILGLGGALACFWGKRLRVVRYSIGAKGICHLSQPHDPMDAIKKAIETPEVRVPLTWGVCCASAASLHAYASLFAAVPRPKTRVLRSLDVGFVIFAISSTLAYYNQPRPEE